MGLLALEGRVIGPGGVGLAGAGVELRPILPLARQGRLELEGREAPVVDRAESDAQGFFTLHAPREGMWEAIVSANGFLSMRYALVPLFESGVLPTVSLPPAEEVRVLVTGPGGRRVRGARWVALPLLEPSWSRSDLEAAWEAAPRSGRTGQEGEIRFTAQRGERLRLFAAAPGMPVQGAVDVRAPGAAELRMGRGLAHEVLIRDAAGRPIDGVLVRDLQSSLPLGRTRQGSLAVFGPERGSAWLGAESEEAGSPRFALPALARKVRVVLPPRVRQPVRVTDALRHEPLAGAWVWDCRDPGRFARTDSAGRCLLEAVDRSTRVSLCASASGHLPDLEPGSTPSPEGTVALALFPARAYAGRVLDEDGAPAQGVEISIEGGQGRVSSRGEVRLAAAHVEEAPRVTASGPGVAAWAGRFKAPRARSNRFTLTLRRGAEVTGQIVDGKGAPVPGAEVRFEGPGALEELPGYRTVTDASGRFRAGGVAAGWYQLLVQAPGRAPFRQGGIEIVPGAGRNEPRSSTAADPIDLGRIRLDDRRRLDGRITDPAGRPVSGVEVWIETDAELPAPDWPDWPSAVSGTDGLFSIVGVPEGAGFQLDLCREGYVPLTFSSHGIFAEPLPLVLYPGATLVGRELDREGLPLSGRGVAAEAGDPFDRRATRPCAGRAGFEVTDGAGWFRLGSLEPLLYRVGGEAVPLHAGETRAIELREPPLPPSAASLTGRLLDAKGLPVSRRRIEAWFKDRLGPRNLIITAGSTTDGEGRFWFAGLEPGRWSLSADSWFHQEVIELRAGESSHDLSLSGERSPWSALAGEPEAEVAAEGAVELQEEAPISFTASVAGRLLGLPPEALARARVGISASSEPFGIARLGTVDSQGSYEISGLAAGFFVDVVAQVGDRRTYDRVWLPAGVPRVTRDLAFEPVVLVEGKVEGPDSEPLAGAQLRFFAESESRAPRRRPYLSTTSGDGGGFSIHLPEGDYRVAVDRPGYRSRRRFDEGTITVRRTLGDREDLRVRLEREVELQGRLPGLTPSDLLELDVEAADQCCVEIERFHQPLPAKIGPEGLYRIAGLGAGTWEVTGEVSSERLGRRETRQRITISDGATEAQLDLDFRVGELTLSGRVVGRQGGEGNEGSNAEDTLVASLLLPDGTQVAAASVRHGTFRLAHLEPGSYRLRIEGGGSMPPAQPIELTGDAEVVLTLPATVEERR
jgi:protocatechuate 3,4-dioxygenase beta subunit